MNRGGTGHRLLYLWSSGIPPHNTRSPIKIAAHSRDTVVWQDYRGENAPRGPSGAGAWGQNGMALR